MSKYKIIGDKLANIPWEERQDGNNSVVWRSAKNPIISHDLTPTSNSIFNSAVVPFDEGFAGVFRVDNTSRQMNIHVGFSKDAVNWHIKAEPIDFRYGQEEHGESNYKYDPRVCKIGEKYYVTWCNDYHGPTIGVGYTYDFKEFYQVENAFLPYNRNGVLFPRKINGNFAILSRPSDTGHTPFGEIFYSESPDMIFWGKHRHVMEPLMDWEKTKIGAGPIPIETNEGWLLIYHGVLTSCNGFVYSVGAALLDLERPWIVTYRAKPYILSPKKNYERVGDVPNVVFPCAALSDAETGRIAIYYGAADTVVSLAYTKVGELIEFIKNNSH